MKPCSIVSKSELDFLLHSSEKSYHGLKAVGAVRYHQRWNTGFNFLVHLNAKGIPFFFLKSSTAVAPFAINTVLTLYTFFAYIAVFTTEALFALVALFTKCTVFTNFTIFATIASFTMRTLIAQIAVYTLSASYAAFGIDTIRGHFTVSTVFTFVALFALFTVFTVLAVLTVCAVCTAFTNIAAGAVNTAIAMETVCTSDSVLRTTNVFTRSAILACKTPLAFMAVFTVIVLLHASSTGEEKKILDFSLLKTIIIRLKSGTGSTHMASIPVFIPAHTLDACGMLYTTTRRQCPFLYFLGFCKTHSTHIWKKLFRAFINRPFFIVPLKL